MPFPSLSQLPGAAYNDSVRSRLMLVDDQPLIIQALHQVFDGIYDLVFATTGKRALEMCLESPPDLMLLDVSMPEMSGLELCLELKRHEQTRDIPVLFVTAGGGMEEEDACWAAGCVDFITKPISPNTIRHRVHAHLTLKLQADLLRKMVFIDGLTMIANRRYFDDMLVREWRRGERGTEPLALAMIDVDHFKRYNDTYGHQAGDDCLKRVATAIRACLQRPQDLVARYGGEEFACVLPQTDLAGATQLCEKMAAAVRALGIAHSASSTADVVTVSIGVAAAASPGANSADDLVRVADGALYAAKQAGRGRVQTA